MAKTKFRESQVMTKALVILPDGKVFECAEGQELPGTQIGHIYTFKRSETTELRWKERAYTEFDFRFLVFPGDEPPQ